MKSVVKLLAAARLCAAAMTPALADPGTKVALVPGGPHPYFSAWEQAGMDAMKDFNLGAGDYRVPQKWELAQQSQLLESLLTQGYNSFLIFPGDAVGTNAVVQEITENGGQAIATAGCLKDPTPALFCMGTDTGNSAYLGTKELIKAMGGKGKIAHFTGFLVDPNTQLRIDAVNKAAAETNGAVEVRAGDRRHRRAAARGREDQRLSRGQRRQCRRHRDHRMGARRDGRQLAAQDRRQAHQDGRHRP